jgi:phosphoglycerate dehydrogenase-like enzyme
MNTTTSNVALIASNNLIAIEPKSFPEYEVAVTAAGGLVAPLSPEVEAVIWTDYSAPQKLETLLENNPQIRWVQLPFAGVDAFADTIAQSAQVANPVLFTSAKGCYREPVAEHALALTLALCRALPERIAAKSWGRKFAVSLYESRILIIGGGGITEELLLLLAPYRTDITVIRKHGDVPMPGASRTLGFDTLGEQLPQADIVILAAALTNETNGLFNAERLALMKPTAYLINVARGPMIVSADLQHALQTGVIAGAATDVTDPEPLPDGHPLWNTPNLIITPHTADTRPMVVRLFSKRITENVAAYLGGRDMIGRVDAQLGY